MSRAGPPRRPKPAKKNESKSIEQLFQDALRLEKVGRFDEGLALARQVVKKKPEWAQGHYALGSLLCAKGLLYDAEVALRKSIARNPKLAGVWSRQAEVLNRLGHFDEAAKAATAAVELSPKNAQIRVVKAMVLWLGGHAQEAHAFLDEAIDEGVVDPNLRSTHGAIAGQIGKLDEGIAELEQLVDEADTKQWVDPFLHSATLMHLSKLYDKAGRYDEAFGAAKRAGDMRTTGYDPDANTALLEDRIRVWSKSTIDTLPRSRVGSEKPVFIVGMPRSGTSLVEQIIASHPLAFGAGELTETYIAAKELAQPTTLMPDRMEVVSQIKRATLDRHARKILKELERTAPDGTERITDKLPNNYEHIGMIGLLFPEAKVIYCQRNALDNCTSCYLLDFVGDRNHGYSYNLAHLAHHYKIHQRYMEHWKQVAPIEILDVHYEDLVSNPVDGAKAIIEHIGLEWDDRCARSHETKRAVSTLSTDQVRKPMYTSSIGRWKHYERHIGVLIEQLDGEID